MTPSPIFLIDDDRDFVESLRSSLEGNSQRQVFVANPSDPIASAREWVNDPRSKDAVFVVDLAILSSKGIAASVEEGLKLIRWLRERNRRVWVESGHLAEEDRKRATELGVEGFIDKGELTVGIEKMLYQIDQPNGDAANGVGAIPPPAMPSRLDERELALSADYDWALEDTELPKTYGGQVVAVSNRRVWGAGRTHTQARKAAEQAGCPAQEDLAFVPISRLSL